MYSIEIGAYHKNSPHLLADLTELLLATSYEKRSSFSAGTVEALIRDGVVSFEELEGVSEEAESSLSSAERQGGQVYLENLWAQFEYREKRFNNYYPFKVSGRVISIRSHLSNEHRLYIFLLASSRLRSFPPNKRIEWAGYFSLLSARALQAMLPPFASVKVFDANSEDRKTFYGTNKRDALSKLGEQLNVQSIDHESIGEESHSGDAGIDLVGVVDFNDNATTNFAIFGQCAARESEWPSKTLEASPEKMRAYFNFLSDPLAITCIPLCFRQSNDAWVKRSSTSGTLLLDRHRILYLLGKSELTNLLYEEQWWMTFDAEFFDVSS